MLEGTDKKPNFLPPSCGAQDPPNLWLSVRSVLRGRTLDRRIARFSQQCWRILPLFLEIHGESRMSLPLLEGGGRRVIDQICVYFHGDSTFK